MLYEVITGFTVYENEKQNPDHTVIEQNISFPQKGTVKEPNNP